ncbi:hypothetical protein [Candidatus Protochlamydia sp. W-9]|uniref:hypothetical protein n=1 Tax=Candidatus Protochlamydia sp. W-9 TaxID=1785087 RepID=UPI001177CBAF|nr:hypothetical protein [Candidatus Protochlamydia sp. W-9]
MMPWNISILPSFILFNPHSTLVSPPSFPLQNLRSLEDLAELMLSEEWGMDKWEKWQTKLTQFIREHSQDKENFDRFLSTIVFGMVQKDLPKALNFLSEVIDLELMNEIAHFKSQQEELPLFRSAFESAFLRASLCTQRNTTAMADKFYGEWKRFRPIAIYFFPNLINLFLGAFNFLDSHKKFTTLWDKYLLLDIVYKFFAIPFFLVQVLQPIVGVTVRVYAIAAAIIVCGGVLAACYQKWLKPLPDEIVNCTNLDKQFERGNIDPKVGMTKTVNQIISALLTGSNILLVGKSGDGKTAVTQRFIQLKHEKKLPQELLKRTNYEVDCGLLISNYSFGHSELINQIKNQIDGFEDQILFHFDELDQLATNDSAFKAFKKRFLTDRPSPLFIATTTFEKLQQIESLDTDGAFRRKIIKIIVDGDDENQNRHMIQELINRTAIDIPIQDEAVEKVLELSKRQNYLPNIGVPAKAIKLLEDAIGKCRWVYSKDFTLLELELAKQELQHMNSRQSRAIRETALEMETYINLKRRIEELEKKEKKLKDEIQNIKFLISQQLSLKENYFRLTHQLAKVFSQNSSIREGENRYTGKKEKEQKIYLLSYFYAIHAFKSALQQKIDTIHSQLHIQVDASLIQQVFNESVALLPDTPIL